MTRRNRLSVFLVNSCCVFGLLTTWVGMCAGQETTADKPKEEDPAAGHSYHGEAFNEGPRQKAYLMKGTGNVTFPATTKSDLAQKFINQGVGQLHGFWYFEAERSFRQAAAIDPDCAIAYWGMAMANKSNSKRAKGFIKEAMDRREKITDREKKYIEALSKYLNAASTPSAKDKQRKENLVKDLETLSLDYPDDIEAKAFLCLQIYLNRTVLKIHSYQAASALMHEVLAKNPMHPVHHYIIHLWDYKKPALALKSSALCGQSAPDIAHMWHMPGHIYSRLKRYNDAVWQQEASARVDHAHMIRDRVLPDQIHNFAHNNEWLIKNLIYTGRIHDAIDLAKNMVETAQAPQVQHLQQTRQKARTMAGLRLFLVLNSAEMWDEMIALCNSPYLEPTNVEAEQIKRLRHLGRAYFQSGNVEKGKEIVKEVEDWKARLEKKKLDAQIKAENKVIAEKKKKIKQAPTQSDEDYEALVSRQAAKELKKAQDAAAKPFATSIRSLDKALEEFRGQGMYAKGMYGPAYDLLKKAGGQDAMFLARLKLLAGDAAEAEKQALAYLPRHKNETMPLAHTAYIQWKAGKKDAARKTFEDLRKISGPIDLDTPVFARLAPVAKDLGYPADWRIPLTLADDLGTRPELDTLGPFRWHPSPAESWSLPDKDGKTHSLADYRGKPVVVIFYLGFGCLHCVEQLKAFAPKAEEFRRQGIELVAISTESREALEIALKNYSDKETFPFPLVADPEYKIFKAYRAFDDFEDQPLHGTYLIDSKGQVRWHDISYEPFMEPDFVLKEAARLFDQDPAPQVVTAKKPAATDAEPKEEKEEKGTK